MSKSSKTPRQAAQETQVENAQMERTEQLIEAAELSKRQVAQLFEQLRKQMTLPGVQSQREQAISDNYNNLLKQLRAGWRLSTKITDNPMY